MTDTKALVARLRSYIPKSLTPQLLIDSVNALESLTRQLAERDAEVVRLQQQDLIEVLCARIKAADDAMADGDYMLDSDDCIAIIRGTWKPLMPNDKPAVPAAQQPAKPAAVVEAIGVDGMRANVTAMYGKSLYEGQFLYAQQSATPELCESLVAAIQYGKDKDLECRVLQSKIDAAQQAQPALSGCACRWDADDKRVATCVRHQGWLDVVQEWVDRAKAAEAQLGAVPKEPDMFWNHDDADRPYSSIDELLNHEICHGTPLEVGDTRTIQRAIRLPNIEIRITAVDDEECEADYEVLAAAPQPKE